MSYDRGKRVWEELKAILTTALFDPRCIVCHSLLVPPQERTVCRDCRQFIRMYKGHACRHCGKFLETGNLCGSCAISPPGYTLHASYAAYENPLKSLIHSYKYHGCQPLKHLFSSLYLELHARMIKCKVDMVIPVPADPSHRREFNPVAEAGKIMATKLSLPFSDRLLIKTRSTPPQARLSQQERHSNLKGAFSAKSGNRLKHSSILLLDDVFTTGATIAACTGALRKEGAKVIALTIAQSLLLED